MGVPVLQITDELLNEVDAAVKGSGEGGRRGGGPKVAAVGVQLCSRCAAPWHGGRCADTALKTEARRLWWLGGGEADFPVRVGAHHIGDEPM